MCVGVCVSEPSPVPSLAMSGSSSYLMPASTSNNPMLGVPNKFYNKFKRGAPHDMPSSTPSIAVGPSGTSLWAEVQADNGTSFQPSQTFFTFTPRSQNLMDNTIAYVQFGATCSASDGSPVYFQQGIWNIYPRIRMLIGGVMLMDQAYKGEFESMNYAFSRADTFDATTGSLMGIGSVVQRQIWASNANWVYIIPINIPPMTAQLWDMYRNQGITIEMYMHQPQNCINAAVNTAAGATYSYTITNPKLRWKDVNYTEESGKLMARIRSISPMYYMYTGYKDFHPPIQAGTSIFQYPIPVKVQAIRKIICYLRPVADYVPTVTDYLTTDFPAQGCTSIQLKMDNNFNPPQPLYASGSNGPVQAYMEAVNCLNNAELARLDSHRDQNNGTSTWKNWERFRATITDFTSNRFLACINLADTNDNDPDFVQANDVEPGNIQLQLNLTFASGYPTVNLYCHIFVIHSALITADSNGNYRLDE